MGIRKSIILVGIALGFVSSAIGQKLSYFSQFHQIPHTLNPSFTGIEDFLDLKAGFRFSTLPSEAIGENSLPNNLFFAANFSLRPPEQVPAGFKSLRTSNAEAAKVLLEAYDSNRPFVRRHGIGITFARRDIGNYDRTVGLLSYALHLPLFGKVSASLGVSGGFLQERLGAGNYQVIDTSDPIYEDLIDNGGSQITADMNAGINLYHPAWYVGYSMNQLLRGVVVSNTANDVKSVQYLTHTAQAGVRFPISNSFRMLVSGVANISPDLGTNFTAMGKVQYLDLVTVGVGYRSEGALTGYIGFLSDYRLNLGYSFDYFFNRTGQVYVTGSHEIVLGFALFNNNYKAPYFW